ncbi:BTB/POZ protein [Rhizophagus irregularis DAOM 181602=DAOM 197198]|nr:BTB/POZ protein [Rhizophagus irregularis DAOM 181602=DAOM 197198]
MDDNKFLPKLSQNLLEILNDNEYYDITIEVVLRYIYAEMIGKSSNTAYEKRIRGTSDNFFVEEYEFQIRR